MNQLLLNRFQDFVINHYFDCNLNTKKICSSIYCSVSTLQRTLASSNNCSIMKHVEYIRILKAIELTYYYKEKKVYYKVGYKSPSVFFKAFFRVTKLNTNCFFSNQLKENKEVAIEARKLAKVNPMKAIEIILIDISKQGVYKNRKLIRKLTKTRRKKMFEKDILKITT